MNEAYIKPDMLRWARERSFGTAEDAARALKVKVEKLVAWEQGDARPTFRKAQELARKLKVPFGYLYLSQPPDEALPLPDLRTTSGTPPRKPSPDFLEVLYDALRKQEWYREYLLSEQAEPVPFVGRFTTNAAINDVAADIRNTIGLDESFRSSAKTRDLFFSQLTQRAEDVGVVVMRSGIVGANTRRALDPEEFQGFAMSDSIAPLIFINQNDYKSAQVFTFAHELAHIWMGLSGVSNLEYFTTASEQAHPDEAITDAVAAETLVPAETFGLRWYGLADIDRNLANLSTHYKVSMFVILRRAFELHKISDDTFRSKYRELANNLTKRTGGGGGYSSVFSRNSPTVATALVFSLLEGRASPKEVSALLNLRISKLPGLSKHLRERRNA